MQIDIPLGIGDLFLMRLIYDKYNLQEDIIFNRHILIDYRAYSSQLENFTLELIAILFPKNNIIHRPSPKHTITNKFIKQYSLSPKDINIKNHFNLDPVFNFDYIVIHTKMRMDLLPSKGKLTDWYRKLGEFFRLAKFKKELKVVILGEKEIKYQTRETKSVYTYSAYDIINQLKLNNHVIDLSDERDLYVKPDINKFLFEIRIVANAVMTFGIGWGGNFAITWGVSDNFSFFINHLNHIVISAIEGQRDPRKKLHRNIDDFMNSFTPFLELEIKL